MIISFRCSLGEDKVCSTTNSRKRRIRSAFAKEELARTFWSCVLIWPGGCGHISDASLLEMSRRDHSVFARYLNTSESTIEKWETGAKQPSGMALRLLSVVEKHGLEALS